jgi:hypothetical protein
MEKTILKWVYCSYNGNLTVFDIKGVRVTELCGPITYEKYEEIEKRTDNEFTVFDGLESLRCFSCGLKKLITE